MSSTERKMVLRLGKIISASLIKSAQFGRKQAGQKRLPERRPSKFASVYICTLMFNKRIKIKELLATPPQGQLVTVMGWVRTFRNNQFVALNDGSTNQNLQVVLELGKYNEELLKRITTSAS